MDFTWIGLGLGLQVESTQTPIRQVGECKVLKNSAIDSFPQAKYDSETIETFPQLV